ncbi:MAG TPA: acyltransferase [Puia sp.]|nr:acyltransferase [Puia sp.]
MQFLNYIINKLGKKGYKVDERLSNRDKFIILWDKFFSLARGFYHKLFFKHSTGLLFVGRHCKIRYCHKITAGRTITIGDNVEINALCVEGVRLGNNITILRNTVIECTGNIKNMGVGLIIGDDVGISQNCFIQVRGRVTIGSHVMFGPNVSIFSENHGFTSLDMPMISQPTIRGEVIIEDDVWLGTRSVILSGVRIGKGSIIAAGALVNRDIPPYSIVAGVPGKVIKSRLNNQAQ